MRILLIEDEPLIALSAQMALAAAGHDVIGPYKTHEHAMDAAKNARPEIAIVDINLAGQNEGIEIARALFDQFGIRSIFATGQPDLARGNRGRAFGILQKPYSPDDLVNTVPVLARLAEGGAPPSDIPAGLELFV